MCIRDRARRVGEGGRERETDWCQYYRVEREFYVVFFFYLCVLQKTVWKILSGDNREVVVLVLASRHELQFIAGYQ